MKTLIYKSLWCWYWNARILTLPRRRRWGEDKAWLRLYQLKNKKCMLAFFCFGLQCNFYALMNCLVKCNELLNEILTKNLWTIPFVWFVKIDQSSQWAENLKASNIQWKQLFFNSCQIAEIGKFTFYAYFKRLCMGNEN